MLRRFNLFPVAITLFFASTFSHASFDQFTYSNGVGGTWTWQEAASPTPVRIDVTMGIFQLAGVAGDPTGGVGILTFYTSAALGGFEAPGVVDFYSAQLFAGNLASPTFSPGIYTGRDYRGNANATLTIAAIPDNGTDTVTHMPEPETYIMLLAGLGLLGFAARRKH
jgi:hypothetical protein